MRKEEEELHHSMRGIMQKAQQVYRSKGRAIAIDTAREGRLVQQLRNHASSKASHHIFWYHNPHLFSSSCCSSSPIVIDLHGLRQKEAVAMVAELVSSRWKPPRCSCKFHHIQLVTGRGTHNRSGRAVLLPAVRRCVLNHKLKIVAEDSGSVTVSFRKT